MTNEEKQMIQQLPEKFRPLSAWAYWGYTLLFCIPVVGFIFLIIFACSGKNVNRRSFARSFFCTLIVVLIIALILALTGAIGSIFK